MNLHFYKYQGTGNDFVILDNREKLIELTKEEVAFLCHRRFGIGADGLMLLDSHAHFDFEMKYYNADGAESSMCGNGGRCLVKFASEMGIIRSEYHFIAIDGEHKASILENGHVSLKMQDVDDINAQDKKFILNTGSPHYVEIISDIKKLDVFTKGRAIRNSDLFRKEGINVNFVEKTDKNDCIIVRTYERGVEDETYSCGTGVTAAALVCYQNDNGYNHINVETKGGQLAVEFNKDKGTFKDIWLIGPATKVYEGDIQLSNNIIFT